MLNALLHPSNAIPNKHLLTFLYNIACLKVTYGYEKKKKIYIYIYKEVGINVTLLFFLDNICHDPRLAIIFGTKFFSKLDWRNFLQPIL
jgi:hypothetical protein